MKNRTNSQRWLAIIMTLILIISLFPTMAFATEQLTTSSGEGQSEVVLPANQMQVVENGGTTTDGTVTVSKTLEGTDIENVFDITLTVSTQNSIEEIYKAQDMAVVIVMDISNTMNDPIAGADSRYDAALEAANAFIDKFQTEAANYPDVNRKIGYVAFNTNAHTIADLQDCVTPEQAVTLKGIIASNTSRIINNYISGDITRFTNIEAGLKLGYDMLASAQENNKYIIFLSDGFPTTYISSGYNGYNPYMSSYYGSKAPGTDGYFYDQNRGVECTFATSYSDKGADRADDMAAAIKASGATIFSIGVGLGDQTVEDYYYNNAGQYTVDLGYSVNDRYPSDIPVIGTTAGDYKSWLEYSIGSGYYYDSTDTSGLMAAYDSIFAEIKALNQASVEASWVVSDPMNGIATNYIDFISFYDKDGVLTGGSSLYGTWSEGAEDTASLGAGSIIDWDLKNSGFSKVVGDDQTETYTYSLKYRVRLANEAANFVELQDYDTNGKTTLTYQIYNNGVLENPETIDFPIPAVEGYLCEFEFTKISGYDNQPLEGATFALTHDSECSVCAQIGKDVNIGTQHVTSEVIAEADDNGKVRFENIPSGHEYTLAEVDTTGIYIPSSAQYKVTAAYDQLTITPLAETGATSEAPYNFAANTFVNFAGVDLYAVKELSHAETGEALTLRAGQFSFELLDADRKVLQTKTNDAQGYVNFDTEILKEIAETKLYIREKNTAEDGITYDTSVYEVTVTPVLTDDVYSFDVTYSLEGNEAVPVFRNTFTDPVSLTVQKVWNLDAGGEATEYVKVQLYKDGEPQGAVKLNAENNWSYTWNALAGNHVYTVIEVNVPDGFTASQETVNGVIIITNTYAPGTPPPPPAEDEYTSVTVKKEWVLDNGGSTVPVSVQLYKDGVAYGLPAELSEANDWTCTWDGLLVDGSVYTAKEIAVEGFTVSQAEVDGVIVITNDDIAKEEPPVEPEPDIPWYPPYVPPVDPIDPVEPPVEIEDPDVPLVEEPVIEEPVEIEEPEVPLAEVPETGAEMNFWPFITLISALSLLVMAVANRKKCK